MRRDSKRNSQNFRQGKFNTRVWTFFGIDAVMLRQAVAVFGKQAEENAQKNSKLPSQHESVNTWLKNRSDTGFRQLQPDFYTAITDSTDKDKNRLQDKQVGGHWDHKMSRENDQD